MPDHLSLLRKDRLIRKVFSLSGADEIYLVGGYIRDALASGRRSNDLDFTVKTDYHRVACDVAAQIDGKAIALKKESLTRVVTKGRAVLDFTPMQGGSIDSDLRARDFKMNAVAWSPAGGIVDITGGLDDIQAGLISAISRDNLLSDPLRVLRAYRFHSELGWRISPSTRRMLKELSPLLVQPATERITLELIKTVSSINPIRTLRIAYSDGIIGAIISSYNSQLANNVKLVSRIYERLSEIPQQDAEKTYPQGLTYTGLLMIEALMLGSDGQRLALSRDVSDRLRTVSRLYPAYKALGRHPTPDRLFELFRDSKDSALDLLILSENWGWIPELLRYRKIDKHPVISPVRIMTATGIQAGKELGWLIQKMKLLEFKGEINTLRDALSHLKSINSHLT